jgi:hypothetical protein
MLEYDDGPSMGSLERGLKDEEMVLASWSGIDARRDVAGCEDRRPAGSGRRSSRLFRCAQLSSTQH